MAGDRSAAAAVSPKMTAIRSVVPTIVSRCTRSASSSRCYSLSNPILNHSSSIIDALRSKARPKLGGPTAADPAYDPDGSIVAQQRIVVAVPAEPYIQMYLVWPSANWIAKIPHAMMPFSTRALVKVLQIGFWPFPYLHASRRKAIMWKVQRLRESSGIARIERGQVSIENFYRCGYGVRVVRDVWHDRSPTCVTKSELINLSAVHFA